MKRRMLLVSLSLVVMLSVGCPGTKQAGGIEAPPLAAERASPVIPPPEPYIPPAPEPVLTIPEPLPAAPGPSATAARDRTYTVQKGDTLIGIARKVYGNPAKFRDIAAANGIADPNRIRAGQVLILP